MPLLLNVRSDSLSLQNRDIVERNSIVNGYTVSMKEEKQSVELLLEYTIVFFTGLHVLVCTLNSKGRYGQVRQLNNSLHLCQLSMLTLSRFQPSLRCTNIIFDQEQNLLKIERNSREELWCVPLYADCRCQKAHKKPSVSVTC